MEKNLINRPLLAFFVVFLQVQNLCGQAQPCTNNNTLVGTAVTLTNDGVQRTINTCIERGEYMLVNVTSGNTYRFSTCSNGVLSNQLSFYNNVGGTGLTGVTSGTCLFLGGQIKTWQATFTGQIRVLVDGSACGTAAGCIDLKATAWAPPSNDNPCNAIALTPGASRAFGTYTNFSATSTAGVPAPTCGNYVGQDVWFRVTVPASGRIGIELRSGTMSNPAMAVYTAASCTGTFTQRACDDDSGEGNDPQLTVSGLTAGSTAYVRVWDWGNDDPGTFDIAVTDNPPSNDDPCNAVNLGFANFNCNFNTYTTGGALTTNIVDNLTLLPAPTCGTATVGDVWFMFDAPFSGKVQIYTQAGTLTDAAMAVYASSVNCGGTFTELACNDTYNGNAMPFVSLSGLTPSTTYYVRIWGASGNGTFGLACLDPEDIAITGTTALCEGSNLSLTAETFNGATYAWSGPLGSRTGQTYSATGVTGTAAGTYTVTVTLSGGCSGSNSRTVTVNPRPVVSISPASATLTCATTSVTLTATGGGTYAWSNAATTPSITVSSSGTYRVTVTGANGCTTTASRAVSNNTTPPTITFSPAISTLTCGTPSRTITASGGGTYLWNTGATTAALTVNSAGSYTVTVTGATNGCTASATRSVGQNTTAPALSVNPPSAALACNAPTRTFTVSNTNVTSPCAQGQVLINLSLTTDNFGNETSWQVLSRYGATVYGSGSGYASNTTYSENICVPDTACLRIVVDDSFGDGIIGAGTYSFTANGNILASLAPFTFQQLTIPDCNLIRTRYLWSNGATTPSITVGTPGTYTVTATTGNGCTSSATAMLNALPILFIQFSNPTLTCTQPTSNLTVIGGSPSWSYQWSDGGPSAPNRTISLPGSYSVTATDFSTGCNYVASPISIFQNIVPPTANVTPASLTLTCATLSGTLTASGGGTYLWSTGATTAALSVNAPGTYTVTVTDAANGCTASVSRTVNQNTSAPAAAIAPASLTLTCATPTGTLTASGGGTYLWSNGATTAALSVNAPGTYTVTVTDAVNGCTATVSRTVNQNNTAPTAFISPVSLTLTCALPTGTLTASGNGTYLWNTGATTAALGVNAPGNYTVTVTNPTNGCTASVSRTVNQPSPLVLGTGSISATCFGYSDGLAFANATGGGGGYSYSWSDGQPVDTAYGLPAGIYSVTVLDGNGCTASGSVAVGQAAPLVVNPTNDALDCYGNTNGSVSVTAAGGTPPYQYLWENAATGNSLSNLAVGIYEILVSDANGCMSNAQAEVFEPTQLMATFASTNENCAGAGDGTASVIASNGTPPYTITWSNGQTGPLALGLSAGTFTVTVQDANGCSISTSLSITAPNPLLLSVSSQSATCQGFSDGRAFASASGGTGLYTFLWSDGQPADTAFALPAGVYQVTVTDVNGCTISASTLVTEPDELAIASIAAVSTCPGSSNGAISVSASGGVGSVQYLWDNGQTGASLSNLGPGLYSVTASDANGCSVSASEIVNQYNTVPSPVISPAIMLTPYGRFSS